MGEVRIRFFFFKKDIPEKDCSNILGPKEVNTSAFKISSHVLRDYFVPDNGDKD